MRSMLAVALIVVGWLLCAAGMFVIGLSHVRKGASWREAFEQDGGRGRWTKDDEQRAARLRRLGRGMLAVGVPALFTGYVIPV
jgi:hypothetical protein